MRDLFRGSSTLALRPCLQHYEGFALKSIPLDLSVPQHLQGEFILELLRLSSPVHTASPQAHRGRTSNTEFTHELETPRTRKSASSKYKKRSLGDLNTLITNKHSHNNTPIGWICLWIAQVLCEKIRIEKVEENSRKITFKTLLINSPFDWKYLLLKQVEKTS